MGEEILPYLLDFWPLQSEEHTRIHPFFEHLKAGRLTTTQCRACSAVFWQPRIVCSHCNADDMAWIDLPKEGELVAFTAVMAGAPLGMEKDVPFVTGLVKLRGTNVTLSARIDDAAYEELSIGQTVRLKVIDRPDGRVWFRFTPKR